MKHSLFAAALLALTLSACGQKEAAVATPATAAPVPAAQIAEPAPSLDASKPADSGVAATPDSAQKVQ